MICASVNDVIVHGIPDKYRLRDGDLVSIDFGAELDGWTGDAAVSFTVGRADDADLLLIETAEKALAAGVAAAVAGARIGDISAAIGAVSHAAGYGVPAVSAATGSAAGCMRTRTCRTTASPAAACACGRAWCWPSSRC